METLVLVVHILVALAMIGLILLQQGKGAEAGASFGGGGSATVFGASGSGNFLSRSTAVLVTIFFITSIALAVFAKHRAGQVDVLPGAPATTTTVPVSAAPQPAAPVTAAPATTAPAPVTTAPAAAGTAPAAADKVAETPAPAAPATN